ncbi:serine protease 40-like [Balaenoptera ricei]|uniref:serine protease 40-like n=1 Tax=Balaenoptera ricei TaxID=2746895 RepID=UPI0028BE9960|nr:serine protease 40-like [Balaenoptera ricei]
MAARAPDTRGTLLLQLHARVCARAAGGQVRVRGVAHKRRRFLSTPQGPREPLSAQSGRRCRIDYMEIKGAGGSGPGWRGACTLAVILLYLHSLLLHTEVAGTTTAGPPQPAAPGPPLRAEEVCGRPAVTGKIFGGRDAPEKRWPWQVSLLYNGQHICGAALISAYWVASAAHCFQLSHDPSAYKVLLGYYRLKTPTSHSRQASVYRVIVNTDFNKRYYMGSDITLLQLYRPVDFSDYIRPVCLPGPNTQLPPHTSCWITGWGMVSEERVLSAPYTLQEGEVGVIDSQVCTSYFQGPDPNNDTYSIRDDMLCAGDLMTGKSICRGDSGGPLVCQLNNTWLLIGLSSWSRPCQEPISPSVFTKVSYFAQWISKKQAASPNAGPSSRPPESRPPSEPSFTSLGSVHKPSSFLTLVTSQTFLLLLSFLWTQWP